MAIIFPYKNITPQQKQAVSLLLDQFPREVSQCSLHPDSAQVVLNETQITHQRGQTFLDNLIDILKPDRWGTDLPISFPERNNPPLNYTFKIRYDPQLR